MPERDFVETHAIHSGHKKIRARILALASLHFFFGDSRRSAIASKDCSVGGLESTGTMQPGRPFLRSLQATFLRHIKGKVHAEDGSFRFRGWSQRCVRSEGGDSDPWAAPLGRSDIVSRVLAALKSCSGVDSSKVTEHANFEEDLGLEKGDVVVLILAMLKKYDLSLSYVEARRMATCVEVINYIESQVCQEYSSSSEDH